MCRKNVVVHSCWERNFGTTQRVPRGTAKETEGHVKKKKNKRKRKTNNNSVEGRIQRDT